jgi:hypothetical protein
VKVLERDRAVAEVAADDGVDAHDGLVKMRSEVPLCAVEEELIANRLCRAERGWKSIMT